MPRASRAKPARPAQIAAHHAENDTGRYRSVAMSPVRTRSATSRSPNAPITNSRLWATNTNVTAPVAVSPPTVGRVRNTARITDARMNPNTVLVNTPATVAPRYVLWRRKLERAAAR